MAQRMVRMVKAFLLLLLATGVLAGVEDGKQAADIKIEFTGLRPGEKLFEELLADKESTIPTAHPLVRTAKATIPNQDTILKVYSLLAADSLSNNEIKDKLLGIVPEYDPEQRQNRQFTNSIH